MAVRSRRPLVQRSGQRVAEERPQSVVSRMTQRVVLVREGRLLCDASDSISATNAISMSSKSTSGFQSGRGSIASRALLAVRTVAPSADMTYATISRLSGSSSTTSTAVPSSVTAMTFSRLLDLFGQRLGLTCDSGIMVPVAATLQNSIFIVSHALVATAIFAGGGALVAHA
jgi:hypothetical protein